MADTTAIIPEENAGKDNDDNNGGKKRNDRMILPPLPELLVILCLQVDDTGCIIPFVEMMIDLVQPLTVLRHIRYVAPTVNAV